MGASRRLPSVLIGFATIFLTTLTVFAADPGSPLPDISPVSDQRAGSILFFNVYTSSAANSGSENTRVNITNTSSTRPAIVHIFFIDGSSCSPADNVLCLTANQTASFTTGDLDPGTAGYIVAVATDENGCPIKFNFLIGDEYVKFASGHEGNLGAEAVGAIEALPCNDVSPLTTLNFNDVQYGRLPATVAVDNIQSRVDGNDTLVVINRPSGNLAIGADTLGTIGGILYSDEETPYSFMFTSNQCQFKFSVNNTTPRTAPRFTTVVPAGHSGWIKFYTYRENVPLLGAVFNFNPSASSSQSAFNQGHNLHKLRLTNSSIVIPVFPPNCS